jgi:hypothetical protein
MASTHRACYHGGRRRSRALYRPTNISRTNSAPELPSELTEPMSQPRPHTYNNPGYMSNGAAGGHPNLPPGAAPLLPNNGRIIQTGAVRVLCIADVRGEIVWLRCPQTYADISRKPEVSQRTCKASTRGPYRTHWRLRIL